jgi:thiamine biosynthesis lipoprotein
MGASVMERSPRRSWVQQIMGLPVSVLARGAGAGSSDAEGAVTALFAELVDVDAVFSPYRTDSEVSRLASGALTWQASRSDVREVAARCQTMHTLTGGLFDATTPAGTWDPSGLVKGWAAQRAMRLLAAVPEVDWCLNAGGDVAVLSSSGQPFAVGIQDPFDDAGVICVVNLAGGAVATSGTAARGAHLYDPRTGEAALARWASVTVVGPDLEIADVLATAAFVAGETWLDVLSTSPRYSGLAVDGARGLHASSGWPGTLDT